MWSTSELQGVAWIPGSEYVYNIAFRPPLSLRDGCHKIKIKTDRPHSVVYSRSEYCASQSPSDILAGTKFGEQMEGDLTSDEPGRIPLGLQAGYLYVAPGYARVQVALDFPWDSLRRKLGRDWVFRAKIGTLVIISTKDGTAVARLSDFACCSGDSHIFESGNAGITLIDDETYRLALWLHGLSEVAVIPDRYQAQVKLAPRDYHVKVVLSDGEKFGRAVIPLTIDAYDGKQLAISSVMLCKRYRDAHVAAVERAAANFAPQYVPLVSKGIEFTPAGDTRFKKGEPLIPYFEVYEPLLAAGSGQSPGMPASAGMTTQKSEGGNPPARVTVEAHIRILDAKTGAVVKDFPPVDATPYENPGSTTIPIAREIPFDQLPKGAYCLEVQASDSAGRSTVVRTADFTVE
jgi:hypothetical protein